MDTSKAGAVGNRGKTGASSGSTGGGGKKVRGNNHHNRAMDNSIAKDPELEAEIFFAKENGLPPPPQTAPPTGQAKSFNRQVSEDLRKVTQALINGDNDVDKISSKAAKNGGNCKAERKARSRGVSGCSTKKDGNRFEYGLDCIDLAYDNDSVVSGTDSEAEYDEYADYVFKYSDKEIRAIIHDYFLNGNKEEALASLEKFKITNDTLSRMVKDLIQLSVEGASGGTLELGSQLLTTITDLKWIPIKALIEVLQEVVESLVDLSIDSPKIVEGMSVFMAKLVEQKVITCEMVQLLATRAADGGSEGEVGKRCYEDTLTFAKNRTLLQGKCVPSGGHQSVEVLSDQFKLILKEFLISNDKEDASLRVKDLKVPHYNHEFAYQAGILALEKMHDLVMTQLSALLKDMFENGILLQSCLEKGYERLYDSLGDLYFDLPAAHTLAKRWVDKSLKAGIIDDELARKCPAPLRIRARTLSEGPDGKLSVEDEIVDGHKEDKVLDNGVTKPNQDDLIAKTDLNAIVIGNKKNGLIMPKTEDGKSGMNGHIPIVVAAAVADGSGV